MESSLPFEVINATSKNLQFQDGKLATNRLRYRRQILKKPQTNPWKMKLFCLTNGRTQTSIAGFREEETGARSIEKGSKTCFV
jgi:hypothetical protein